MKYTNDADSTVWVADNGYAYQGLSGFCWRIVILSGVVEI
jgi:hypothetical protein